MNKNFITRLFLIAVLVIASSILFSHPSPATAHDPANITGYLWSDTIGWISMNCINDDSCGVSDYGVNKNPDGSLTGYAWSPNVGWIKFGGLSGFPENTVVMGPNGPIPQQNAIAPGNFYSGNYFGWIRACAGTVGGECSSMESRADGWDGWISLYAAYPPEGTNIIYYRPLATHVGGPAVYDGSITAGYAWGSDVVGWLDFDIFRTKTNSQFDVRDENGVSLHNLDVNSGTVPTFVWTVTDPHIEPCKIYEKSSVGGVVVSGDVKSDITTSGTQVGTSLVSGIYTYKFICGNDYDKIIYFRVVDVPTASFDIRSPGTTGTSLSGNTSVPSGTIPTFVWDISYTQCRLNKLSAGGTSFTTMLNLTTSGTYEGDSLTVGDYSFSLKCGSGSFESLSYINFTVVDTPVVTTEFDVRSPGATGISLNGDTTVPNGTVPTFTWAIAGGGTVGDPIFKGSYDTSGSAVGTYISGNYAYVADGDAGLQIIDISNTSAPSFVGSYDTPGAAHGVVVVGNYAYVADMGAGLQVINVSNPSSPTLAGSLDTPGLSYELVVSGNYAYVADASGGLQIINISNPASPTLTGTYVTLSDASQVSLQGNRAYVASAGAGMQIIDIGNPSSPSLVSTISTAGYASGVDVSGNYAYVAASTAGLQIFDVSNPSSPSSVGLYNTPGDAWEVRVYGNYAYVADMNAGFHIIDVSDPAAPTLAGTYDTPGNVVDVMVSGNYAYASDGGSGLQIFEVGASDTCEVNKISGGTPIDSSNPDSFEASGTGDRTGNALTVPGVYEYVMDCSSASPSVRFTVLAESIQAFSLGGTETARIQFIGGNQADSEIRSVYVYPSGGFSYPVTISISGYPTPPADTVFTYSLGGGEFLADPPDVVINSPYDIGINFQMRSSKPITSPYTVTLTGTTDTQTATKDIIILPKGFDPRYEQF